MEGTKATYPDFIARLQHRQQKIKNKHDQIKEEIRKADSIRPLKPAAPKRKKNENYYTVNLTGQSITTFTQTRLRKMKPPEQETEKCKCLSIEGHLEAVNWMLWPREYIPSPGYLQIDDWTEHPFIWMNYAPRHDGKPPTDQVLLSGYSSLWDITGVQRYFIGKFHCEEALFYYQYPNLNLPSRYGRHLWKINAASKTQSLTYKKEFGISLEFTLKKIEASEQQMDRIVISDQLIKLDSMDKFKRQTFFRLLLRVLSFQENLQLVSFENMGCKRLEGVRLIQQLASFNSETLKYLFLWHFVSTMENPLLINYSYITGTGKYIPRPDTKQCFIRSLGAFRNLRILGLEYAHIADDSGAALLGLISVIKRPHFRLHLMCRSKYVPGRVDTSLGCGGKEIPDTAWRRVQLLCPNLYLSMVFFRIRGYDNLRRFLTPSIPLNDVHMDMGIDIYKEQTQDSDLYSFVRHLAYRYASNLVTLSIHQWRCETFSLRRILELIPGLERFFYVGKVESEVDLKNLLILISTGVCRNLQQIKIQVQDESNNRDYWKLSLKKITEEYTEVLKLYNIAFSVEIYKI